MKELYINITPAENSAVKRVEAFVRSLPSGRWVIKATKGQRSTQANAYLHGIVLPMILDALRDRGYDLSGIEDVKQILKQLFLKVKSVEGKEDDFPITRNTSDLTKEEFSFFLDQVIRFASEKLGIVIPDPEQEIFV